MSTHIGSECETLIFDIAYLFDVTRLHGLSPCSLFRCCLCPSCTQHESSSISAHMLVMLLSENVLALYPLLPTSIPHTRTHAHTKKGTSCSSSGTGCCNISRRGFVVRRPRWHLSLACHPPTPHQSAPPQSQQAGKALTDRGVIHIYMYIYTRPGCGKEKGADAASSLGAGAPSTWPS